MFIITIYTLCLIVNLTSVDGKRGCECKSWPANGKFCHLLMHSRRVVVSYKRKYVHEVLVNCLFKLAQEKVWLGELTIRP